MQANSPKIQISLKITSLILTIILLGLLGYFVTQKTIQIRTAIVYFCLSVWFYYTISKLVDIGYKLFSIQRNNDTKEENSLAMDKDAAQLLKHLKLHLASLTLAIGNILYEFPLSDELKNNSLLLLLGITIIFGLWGLISPTQKRKKPA